MNDCAQSTQDSGKSVQKPTMLWVPDSANTKTGPIPQGYVGATRQETEESCKGCPMRKNLCYYWRGMPVAAHSGMQRRNATDPARYTIERAISRSRRSAKFARGAVGGDPSVFDRSIVQTWTNKFQAAGFRGLLLYTHFAETRGSHLKGLAMASTNSFEQSDRLLSDGWHVAQTVQFRTPHTKRHSLKHLPVWQGQKFKTPSGKLGVVCPAQTRRGIDCNSCGLCSNHQKKQQYIIFLMH